MRLIPFHHVKLRSGFLRDKQELNRTATIHAVYDRFSETGRIAAFKFDYKEGDPLRPHFFWDSDVAKWMEGAAYILHEGPDPVLEARIDELVEDIKRNQDENGYFNIYFTVIQPENRWKNRDWHELYCAGHLMEAAVAYAEATGKEDFLHCMEKYAAHIRKVFMEDHSAEFDTPGHEEIELALVKMYRYTKNPVYLDMAAYFVNTRGTSEDRVPMSYNQSHAPVREQTEAVGHAVRAMYLYTGMANLAAETGDEALAAACKTLWEDAVDRKMYITGGLGSTYIGEAFTTPFDLPPDGAYTETCAGIGLCFFGKGMMELENDARYADAVERVLYNGVLSGLSLDGQQFFYENPLEVNLSERFNSMWGARRFPAHRRVACFGCSCCPPNVNRLLPSLGEYLYGLEEDVLYINQFADSEMTDGDVTCRMETCYPLNGRVTVTAAGVREVAIRIPAWCDKVTFSKPHRMSRGYAIFENDGTSITVEFDLTPRAVWADPHVLRGASRIAVMRGPVVYCAEGVDNGERQLHNFLLPTAVTAEEITDTPYGLPALDVPCFKQVPDEGPLYRNQAPTLEPATLHLIPYYAFANREESDMRVWFYTL